MVYESFDNSKNKFQKIYEKNENNSNIIKNDLEKMDVNFSSINFNKDITTIPITVISGDDQDTINELREQNEEDFGNEADELESKLNNQGSSIFISPLNTFVTINLFNTPEWIINHINIIPIIELVGDVNDDTIYSDISIIAKAGQLKIGDIQFTNDTKYWLVKLSENNYLLKILLDITVSRVNSVNQPIEGNFTALPIPFTLDLSVKILNPRIYEKTNIHKS